MKQINSKEEFLNLRNDLIEQEDEVVKSHTIIAVGMATCGISSGADEIYDELMNITKEKKLDNIMIRKTGCLGECYLEPIVEVRNNKNIKRFYNVTKNDINEILENVNHDNKDSYEKDNQIKIALEHSGIINPESIGDYIINSGYEALNKVLFDMNKDDVIEELKNSGLRGRGGAGFPTGLKWESAKNTESDIKYIVCNADEGDPGAFMDRAILEGDPHRILEAMTIAGYVIGANKGIIYIRAEYPLAVKRLKKAIGQALEYGFLGNRILGTDFNFTIDINLGAGAFVCGEETALLNSIEGLRGEPRMKPPFPAQSGLFGKPTNINNVETYANIPPIILKGSNWFNKIGTETSKGTKVFALAGKINKVGLIEVPMGTTLRSIIYDNLTKTASRRRAAESYGNTGGFRLRCRIFK